MPPLLALFSWPLVVLALARNLNAPLAFILAILAGFLLLPETIKFNLPLLPSLNKHSIPALSVLLFYALFRSGTAKLNGRTLIPQHPFILIAVAGLLLGTLATVATNGDPLRYGPKFLPGMRLYDGLSLGLSALIMLLPMFLARKFLACPESHLLLLRTLCFAALGYSLLALFEVRMSPQLNSWIYGFFPHSFVQHYRGGSWRPIVFLSHGLVLSIFFCLAVLAAAGLARIDETQRSRFLMATGWLFLTLFFTRSLGAFAIAIMLLPVALFWGVRGQLMVAGAVAVLVLLYPVARSSGVIPTDLIAEQAESIDPQRAASFRTRIENEDRLLAKAQERPLFGWGPWGRSRIYEPATGTDITVTDGRWTGVLGVGGWFRYLCEFGLLCMPILLLFLYRRRYEIGMASSVLALMLAANLLDLIPNSGVTPVTWMIAGALWGRLELGHIKAAEATAPSMEPYDTCSVYTRSAIPRYEPDAQATKPNRYTRQKTRHERNTKHKQK